VVRVAGCGPWLLRIVFKRGGFGSPWVGIGKESEAVVGGCGWLWLKWSVVAGGTGFNNLNPLQRGEVSSGPGLLGTGHRELPPDSFPASDHGPREPLRVVVVVSSGQWLRVALFLDLSGGCNHGE